MQRIKRFLGGDIFHVFKEEYIYAIAQNMGSKLFGAGLPIVLAIFLNADLIGSIKIFQSYFAVLILVSAGGLDSSILKFCSQKKTKEERYGLLLRLSMISFIIAIIVASLTLVLAKGEILSNFENVNYLLMIGVICLPFAAFNMLARAYLQSQKHFKMLAKIDISFGLLGVIAVVILSYIYGLQGFIIGQVCGIIALSAFLVFKLIVQATKSDYIKRFKFRADTQVYKFGVFSLLSNFTGTVNAYLVFIVLGFFEVDLVQVGSLALAQTFVFALRQLYISINQLAIPRISYMHSTGNSLKSIHKMHGISFIILDAIFILAMPLVLILQRTFFSRFENFETYFVILMLGLVFWSAYSLKGVTLLAIGRSDANFVIGLMSLIVNISLLLLLIGSLGVVGAAIASAVTSLFSFLAIHLYFKFGEVKNEIA